MKRVGSAAMAAVSLVLSACGGSGDDSTDHQTSSVFDAGHLDASTVGIAPYDAGTTALTGTLGTSGAVQPIVSSHVISNSGETLIYMTTAPTTCDDLMTSRWLGSVTPGAQVIEIVVSGPAKVGPGNKTEVNWAIGGRSSSYEQNAKTANVTFTSAAAMGVVEGTVMATYENPPGSLSGHFHAEFCPNGQDY